MTLTAWTTVVPRKDQPKAATFAELDQEAQALVRSSMTTGMNAGHVSADWSPDQVKVTVVKAGPHFEIRALWEPT